MGQTPTIAVVIPAIPPRRHMLRRALTSVKNQTLQPVATMITVDESHAGAAYTRNQGLQSVDDDIEWVAFLDDDDFFGSKHLEKLYTTAIKTNADYVFPWFFTVAGSDPFPQFFKKPWSNNDPHQTTIATLVKRELAQKVGFREVTEENMTETGHRFGEDYQFTLECMAEGAKIVHHPEKTWYWCHHGSNTSGRPDQW